MPAPADLIHETSTTTGTGNLTVAAVNGKVRFSDATYGFGTGGSDVFDYLVSNRAAAEWERGTGHMSDANTLVRDTVIASSNSNNAVSFSAGTKDVTNDVPADEQVYQTASDTVEGKIEIAIQSEMETATDTTRAVTPGRQHFHPGSLKGWVHYDQVTPAINASNNVSSVTDSAAGTFTVNWDTDFSGNTAYASGGSTIGFTLQYQNSGSDFLVGSTKFFTKNGSQALTDYANTSVWAAGDFA